MAKTIDNETAGRSRCPHCGKPINLGSLMGQRNLGRHKQFTEEQRERFRQNLATARKNRWPHLVKVEEPAPVAE